MSRASESGRSQRPSPAVCVCVCVQEPWESELATVRYVTTIPYRTVPYSSIIGHVVPVSIDVYMLPLLCLSLLYCWLWCCADVCRVNDRYAILATAVAVRGDSAFREVSYI